MQQARKLRLTAASAKKRELLGRANDHLLTAAPMEPRGPHQ